MRENLDGIRIGRVACTPRHDGRVELACLASKSPRVPCTWRRVTRNRFTAFFAAIAHGMTHGSL